MNNKMPKQSIKIEWVDRDGCTQTFSRERETNANGDFLQDSLNRFLKSLEMEYLKVEDTNY